MAKLTVRKNARRTLSGKAKENHRLSPAQVATNRLRPKPRPTRKREKVAQDSPVLTNTFNTDQEAQGAAEVLVSLHTHVVPEAPIHWHCPTMFNIAPGTPLVATSGLEDDDDEDSEEIDQLDSDNEEDISNGTSQLDCI